MRKKRAKAASVLDKNGNIWIMGGYQEDPSERDSTEIYRYRSPTRYESIQETAFKILLKCKVNEF